MWRRSQISITLNDIGQVDMILVAHASIISILVITKNAAIDKGLGGNKKVQFYENVELAVSGELNERSANTLV
jgi:hypothetical protein